MSDDDEEVPEYAPGEGYEPSPPPRFEGNFSSGLVIPGGPVELTSKQFKTIVTPMIHDPEDTVGARCFDPGPEVKAEGKMVGLPCVRKRGHKPPHRSFAGEHPESRVFYEWT